MGFKSSMGRPCSYYDALGRYERRLERGVFQAIRELRLIQKERGASGSASPWDALECGGNAAALGSAGERSLELAAASPAEGAVDRGASEGAKNAAAPAEEMTKHPVPKDPRGTATHRSFPGDWELGGLVIPQENAAIAEPHVEEPASAAKTVDLTTVHPDSVKYIEAMARSANPDERELAARIREEIGLPPAGRA